MSLISAMLLSCSSCVTQNKTSIERTSTTQEEIHCDTILPYAEGSFIKLNNDIDLGGKVAQLLSNITLIPGKGVFKNGSLVMIQRLRVLVSYLRMLKYTGAG